MAPIASHCNAAVANYDDDLMMMVINNERYRDKQLYKAYNKDHHTAITNQNITIYTEKPLKSI